MSCPWGAIFWYRSVCPVQPLWLFSRLFFFASLTCVPHKRHQEQPWCFFNFDLSQHSGLMCQGGGPLVPSSLSSLSSEDMNSTALCRFHKAFILALSSGESWALSNNSVRYVNFWTPKKKLIYSDSGITTVKNINTYFFLQQQFSLTIKYP